MAAIVPVDADKKRGYGGDGGADMGAVTRAKLPFVFASGASTAAAPRLRGFRYKRCGHHAAFQG